VHIMMMPPASVPNVDTAWQTKSYTQNTNA
jgi:hypothetical protein